MKRRIITITLLVFASIFMYACSAPTKSQNTYYATSHTESKKIETLVHEAIIKENTYDINADLAYIEHHDILHVDETKTKLIVYARVMCTSYSRDLKADSGIQAPVRLTFDRNGSHYTLKEYWLPQDGSYYETSIREAFPQNIVEKAMEVESYDEEKENSDKVAAKTYFEQKDKEAQAKR